MRDIVSDLRSALYGRIGVMAADLLFANAADEIIQLRAALTTSRADAMEECAMLVSEVPIGYQTKAELAKLQDHVDWCVKAIHERKDKADE